jgi:hypothetical protein
VHVTREPLDGHLEAAFWGIAPGAALGEEIGGEPPCPAFSVSSRAALAGAGRQARQGVPNPAQWIRRLKLQS